MTETATEAEKSARWGIKPCSVDGCPERRVTGGLCSVH